MNKKLLYHKQNKEEKSPLFIILLLVLIVYVTILFIPIIWAIYSSFVEKEAYDTFYTLHFGNFPTKLVISNFETAFVNFSIKSMTSGLVFNFGDLIIHSFLYTIGCATMFTLTPLIVAYCAARFNFKFSKIIYAFVIVAMALPIVGAMPSEIRMLKLLHIYDTFWGLWIMRINFIGINFMIFYAQFETIPMTYTEAAKVDGASNLRILFTIILPQSIPTIVTVFLLAFITFWNDYQIPHAYLPSYPTVAEGLAFFEKTGASLLNSDPIKLAGIIGITLPLVIVFAILNKRLNITVAAGGIKG